MIERVFPALLAVTFVLFLTACEEQPPPAPKPVKKTGPRYVALVIPETGYLEPLGLSIRRGAEMAVADANAAGPERPLKLLVEDETADIQPARRLAADPRVSVVIGHTLESALEKSRGLYLKSGRPVILPVISSPRAHLLGDRFYRLPPSDEDQAAALAVFALDALGAERALVVHENTDHGRRLSTAFARAFGRDGAAGIVETPFLETPEDALSLAESAAGNPPQAVFLALQARSAVHVAQALKEAGVETALLGTHSLALPETISLLGGLSGALYLCLPFDPKTEDEAAEPFLKQYRRMYHRSPNWPAVLAYDAVTLAALAMDRAGDEPDAVAGFLAALTGGTHVFQGLSGSYYFQKGGGKGPIHVVRADESILGFVPCLGDGCEPEGDKAKEE